MTIDTLKIEALIEEAKTRMAQATDELHGLDHVTRVVGSLEESSRELSLDDTEHAALILAAWWHDTARTLTKRTSFIVMPFIDDLISATMLWIFTWKYRLFGPVVGMSTRIIFCKSFGAGKLLTRILLKKRTRHLLTLLKHADALDMLHPTRMEKSLSMIEQSKIYAFGYRKLLWWPMVQKQLKHTNAATEPLTRVQLKQYAQWIKSEQICAWHMQHVGKKWHEKHLDRLHQLLEQHQITS